MKLDIKLSDNVTGLLLVTFFITWLTLLVFFYGGQPDLYDVLMNKLSDGQIAIPAPPKGVFE